MQTIVFIETNKSGSSRDAIKAAVRMGYFTIVFTNREKPLLQREEYPDVHEMYFKNLLDIEELRKSLKKIMTQGKIIKAIVSLVDSYVYIASLLSEEFCHGLIPSKAVEIMEDKIKTHTALKKQIYTPYFVIYKHNQPLEHFLAEHEKYLPLIVKSPSSTGSKDVFFTKTKKELKRRIYQLRSKYPNESVLVEEYLEGQQYLVEAVVYHNQVKIAAVIEQEITKFQRFIVTGYTVLAEVSPKQNNELKDILESITSQLELTNGCLHVELRHTRKGEWKLIEINPRMSGGAMNQMIKAAFGFDYVEESLKVWLGQEPFLIRKSNNYTFTKYITVSSSSILTKVTGKKRAARCPGVVAVYVKPRKGSRLSPPLSMGNRYAYVIAIAETKEKATQYANDGAKQIQFHLTTY